MTSKTEVVNHGINVKGVIKKSGVDVLSQTEADTRYIQRANFMLYGDGFDGAANLDGANAVAWANRVGNVYTMTRACWLTDLVVGAGVTLKPNGYPIYGTGTWSGTGTVEVNGNNAVANAAGAAIGGNHMIGGSIGGAGGAAGSGAGGAGGVRTTLAGQGGAGGAGLGAAGAAGVATTIPASHSNIHTLQTLLNLSFYSPQVGPLSFSGGTGGGGGGGSTGSAGGGGGSGGGTIAIFFRHITFTGNLECKGGNGGNAVASATNGGGGGGGGGGFIVTVSEDVAPAWTRSVAGGIKGNKVNGGADGNNGADGIAFHIQIAA